MSRRSCVGLPRTPVSLRRPPPRARRAASTARVSKTSTRHGATCCPLGRWTELHPHGGQRTGWPRSQVSTTSAPRGTLADELARSAKSPRWPSVATGWYGLRAVGFNRGLPPRERAGSGIWRGPGIHAAPNAALQRSRRWGKRMGAPTRDRSERRGAACSGRRPVLSSGGPEGAGSAADGDLALHDVRGDAERL